MSVELKMRAGKVVEQGAADDLLSRPHHDYTRELLAASPRVEEALARREESDGLARSGTD